MKRDSNPRPSGPKPDALPSCAIHRQISFRFLGCYLNQNWKLYLLSKLGYQNNGVANEIRTRDHRNHNPGLYQLSYSHHYFFAPLIYIPDGTPERIRTFDLWLRRPTLYPTELRAYTLSAERNNTDLRDLRLVFFLLFLSFGLFFDNFHLFILIFFRCSGLLQQFKQIYSLNIYTKLTRLFY